jgi:hypothetical protein
MAKNRRNLPNIFLIYFLLAGESDGLAAHLRFPMGVGW